jgi:uncharacterized protein (TIGR02466 family)
MIIDLFPTTVYVDYIDIDETECSILKGIQLSRNMDNDAWVSDTNIQTYPQNQQLFDKIHKHVQRYAYDVMKISTQYGLKCHGAWLNRNDPGDSTPTHHHSNSLISGVYYLDVDPATQGAIQFYDDREGQFGKFFSVLKYAEKSNRNSHRATVDCENAMLVLFPSALKHSVSQNTADVPRYSIAFDYMITGEFDALVNRTNFT